MASTPVATGRSGRVLDDGVGVDGGDRGIVDRAGGDGDRHGRGGAAVGGVVGGVGEVVGADEVAGRGCRSAEPPAVRARVPLVTSVTRDAVRVVPASGSVSLASTPVATGTVRSASSTTCRRRGRRPGDR